MSLNIGKKLLIVLVVVAAMFAAQSVLDGNVALAAGPGEVNFAGWPLCPGMKYTSPGEMRLMIYNPDTTPHQALGEPAGALGWIRFNGTDASALFGGSFGMRGEGDHTIVMISGNQRVASTVKLYESSDQPRPDNFCSGPSVGLEVAPAPAVEEKDEEIVVTEPVTPTVKADAQVRPDVDPSAVMRKGPGTNYEKMTSLAPGKFLDRVLGKSAPDPDGFVWVQHRSNAGTGWTRSDLLLVNVDLANVPIVEVAPPAEVTAGVVVTPTTIVTTTVTVTPTVKSLCDLCWEVRLETAVVTETIATVARLNRPITLTSESTIVLPADGDAELLMYVKHTTVLEPSGSASILATKKTDIKNRGVKYIVQKGDTVSNIIKKVQGADWKVTEVEILELVTGNPAAFEMTIDGGGNIVFTPVPGAQILFGCRSG